MYRIVYWPVLLLLTLLSSLPLRVHYMLSNVLYFILYHIVKYRRLVVITNLARSFPELKYEELHKLTKDYFHHMCDIMVETTWAYTHSTKRIGKLFVYKNKEYLAKLYGEGRNIVVIIGHQGCWELATGAPNLKETYGVNIDNQDCFFVVKRMHSKVSQMLITRMRERHHSCTIIDANHVFRHVLKKKSEKCIYFIVADQNPGVGAKFAVNFLNQRTLMANGPEFIARKMGMPVLFAGIDRTSRGRYNLTYHLICEDASKCEEGYVTKEYARLLEESINANRSSWLWSHKRWKKRKEEEKDIVSLY